MKLNAYLKKRKTPLVKFLDDDSIARLAKKHNLAVRTVRNMLNGNRKDYSQTTVKSVVESALKMIDRDIAKVKKQVAEAA